MYPILININGYIISSLSCFLILGFIVFNIAVIFLTRRKKLNIRFWNNHVISLTLVTLVGARLLYVLTNLPLFQENWRDILLPDGFSFLGGICCFTILLYFYAKKHKEDFLSWVDIFSIAFLPFLFFSGIGHFLDGSNYGIPTDLPWGVTFDFIDSPVPFTVPIHPTQLYQSGYAIIIFLLLLTIFHRMKYKGIITLLAGLLFSISDLFLNYLLGEETLMIGTLRFNQIIDVTIIALCSGVLFSFLLKKHEL